MKLSLIVQWSPPSENDVRRQHWTKTHRQNLAAKSAWLFALSQSAVAREMMTTLRAAIKGCATSSLRSLELTTAIPASSSKYTIVVIEIYE